MLSLILGIALILCLGVLALLVLDLRRVTRELQYINAHDTNAEVTASTHLPLIEKLMAAINHSLVESRRLKTQQAQQNQQVHQLLTNLTHDIKTPLTVASGYVQLLQKSSPKDAQLLRISHNLTSVNYYLHYLMDFNLSQEQTAPLNLTQIDLSQLVENQLFDAYDELSARHLKVKPHLAPHLLLTSDAALIRRVLQNLIGNWLKYASETAAVTLSELDDNHIQLVFENHTDLTLPDASTLLARFYTSDTARTSSTGLGLSIAAGLMTRLNGTLNLRTAKNQFTAILIFRRRSTE